MSAKPILDNYQVSRQAFHDIGKWNRQFANKLHATAVELACDLGEPAVVTSELLVQAVRQTCEEMAAETQRPSCEGEVSYVPRSRVA